ncbi:MAG: hypothetical protein FWD26_08000 [Treponema sp.]|nr:hypothetical protein [Treponema sp.]
MNPLHIVSIICFALCIFMFFYFKWYIKKRITSSGTLVNELDEREAEISRLIADLERITDRDAQLVEERIKQLRVIIEDADKRIAMYIKELERGRLGETLYTSLGRGIREALHTDTIEISSEAENSKPLVYSDKVIPANVPAPASEPAAQTPPPSRAQIRSHIDLLIEEGLSSQEIASRLNISIAEVNLALNLRRAK